MIRAWLWRDDKRFPSAFVRNRDGNGIVLIPVNGVQNGFRGSKRHLVFARSSAANDADPDFLHRWKTSLTMLAAFATSSRLTSRWVTMRTRSLSTGTARTPRCARVFKK